MVKITEELVRKRAEHNDGRIGSLEELSLSGLHIHKIEYLDRWCRELKILLIQNNIIFKIENLGRLKQLEYLNLSLNIIERIENLTGCESLQKLDLTLNFIGDLLSVESLSDNYNLRELYLTGNPCAKYDGYREFVVDTLPQLTVFDGQPVLRSERITARQKMNSGLKECILQQQNVYQAFREEQKSRIPSFEERLSQFDDDLSEEEKLKRIWAEKDEHSPEVRVMMSQLNLRQQELRENKPKPKVKTARALYNKSDGRPLNINEPRLDFTLNQDVETNCYVLKVLLNRSLDTSDITTDVHPDHLKIIIKGSVFQLCLLEEVKPDVSKAERSLITGTLVITMPLAQDHLVPNTTKRKPTTEISKRTPTQREKLEIGREENATVDISSIVSYPDDAIEDTFIDDPEVPPLESPSLD